MRKISLWAKHHVVAARVIICFIHVALVFLAGYIGIHVHKLPAKIFYLAALAVALGFIFYPRRSKKDLLGKKFYAVQKTCDLIIATGFFIIVCFLSNNNLRLPSLQNSLYAVSVHINPETKKPTAKEILESLKYRDKSTLTKQEKRVLKKELKTQLHIYAKASLKHDKAEQSQTLEIILVIIAALGLLFLLAMLACGISCGGAEGLAIVVAVAGTAAIIWGTVAVLNSMSKKRKAKKQQNAGQVNSGQNATDFSFIPGLP